MMAAISAAQPASEAVARIAARIAPYDGEMSAHDAQLHDRSRVAGKRAETDSRARRDHRPHRRHDLRRDAGECATRTDDFLRLPDPGNADRGGQDHDLVPRR